MTTVAWDGKTLAGDTLASDEFGSLRFTKIFKIDRFVSEGATEQVLLGCAGSIELTVLIRDWIASGMSPDEKPSFGARMEFNGMVIHKDGRIEFMEEMLTPIILHNTFYAIGSGARYSLGAMEMGATAAEAALISSKYDSNTNGIIETLTFD